MPPPSGRADRCAPLLPTLVPRSQDGSVIHDIEEVVDRSLKMVTEGKATAINGDEIEVQADSLCLHGDTPGAVDMARSLQKALTAEGVEIVPVGALVKSR